MRIGRRSGRWRGRRHISFRLALATDLFLGWLATLSRLSVRTMLPFHCRTSYPISGSQAGMPRGPHVKMATRCWGFIVGASIRLIGNACAKSGTSTGRRIQRPLRRPNRLPCYIRWLHYVDSLRHISRAALWSSSRKVATTMLCGSIRLFRCNEKCHLAQEHRRCSVRVSTAHRPARGQRDASIAFGRANSLQFLPPVKRRDARALLVYNASSHILAGAVSQSSEKFDVRADAREFRLAPADADNALRLIWRGNLALFI